MSWAEVKKINSDLSTPLNELMIERPSGIVPNPLYAGDSDSRYYLQTCKSSEIISSDYVESSNKSIQRYNEVWCYIDGINILKKFDLLTVLNNDDYEKDFDGSYSHNCSQCFVSCANECRSNSSRA